MGEFSFSRLLRRKKTPNDTVVHQTSRHTTTTTEDIDSIPNNQVPTRSETILTNASGSFEESEIWDRKAILSLDGGGIRGYSTILIIRALMQAIGEIESNYQGSGGPANSSYHPLSPPSNGGTASRESRSNEASPLDTSQWLPCHYFDYMAGTSTGGLISIMIGRLRMSIDDCMRSYEIFGAQVFGKSRWFSMRFSPFFWPREKYDHRVLQSVVEDVVSENAPKVAGFPGGRSFASDESRCRVVVVAHQESKTGATGNPYLFRTYNNLHRRVNPALDRNPSPAHDIPIWQVARATSAAPMYFKQAKINETHYLDGGFGETNNPSSEIFQDVRIMNNQMRDPTSILISIGTGRNNDMSRFTNSKSATARILRVLSFTKKDITNPEHVHKTMLQYQEDFGLNYNRFDVEQGLDKMKLDEWRVRSKLRVEVGRRVGKCHKALTRRKRNPASSNEKAELRKHVNDRYSEESDYSTSHTEPTTEDCLVIPEFLQPYETIENIRKQTYAYLNNEEVQTQIRKCASLLVQQRRDRAMKDPEKWKRSCFRVWYQCRVVECPRGEKIYEGRGALRQHLLDKHREKFRPMPTQDINEVALERALDEYEVVVQ